MTAALRAWFAPAPAKRLGLLRILAGGFAVGYVIVRSPHLAGFADFDSSRFQPVGVVGVLLDAPMAAWLLRASVVATIVAGVGFVTGWRFRFTGPLFAMLLLWVTSYNNSWGKILHTENLMVLQVLILGFTASSSAYSLDARRSRSHPQSHERYGWPIKLMMLVTVLAYFVSGWAKIRSGGFNWVTDDVLRNQIALDNLRKIQLGDFHSPVGGWLVRFGWVFPPIAVTSLVVELGAPLALTRKWVGQLRAASAWVFHIGILALMAIAFPYQLLGIGFAPFFPVERVWDRVRELRKQPGRRTAVPDPG